MTLSGTLTRMLPLRPRLPALWRRAHTRRARRTIPGPATACSLTAAARCQWVGGPGPGGGHGASGWVPVVPEPRARAAVLVAALGGMCACDCDATRAARWRRGGHVLVCTWPRVPKE